MSTSSLTLIAVLLPSLALADGFDRVKCDADVGAALKGADLALGKRKVPDIENAHKAIQLKYEGGDGVAGDPYGTRFWRICGHEVVTLHDLKKKTEDVVRDVLAVAEHPAELRLLPPSRCKRGAANVDDVLALMPRGKAEGTPQKAWQIDKAKLSFTSIPTEGLKCSGD
jgi:hypothetical protein